MKFYIGTSGFAYKAWRGIFYPDHITPGEMLRFYAGRLDAVEINNTFYHMPTERVITSWMQQTPVDFIFAFKVPQVITHLKRLNNVGSEMQYLLRTLSLLNRKMGPLLFQLPRSSQANANALKDLMTLIPDSVLCAFEFRNPTWQSDEILDLLSLRQCSLCIADTDESPADEIITTASWGYLRLRRDNYSDADLNLWFKRILAQKWKTAFVFFKHENEAKGPAPALRFGEIVKAAQMPARIDDHHRS